MNIKNEGQKATLVSFMYNSIVFQKCFPAIIIKIQTSVPFLINILLSKNFDNQIDNMQPFLSVSQSSTNHAELLSNGFKFGIIFCFDIPALQDNGRIYPSS